MRGVDLGGEVVDAEGLVVEAVAAQCLVVALAAEELHEPIGVAALLAERSDLDAVRELLAGDHPSEMLALVPELHTLGDHDRCGGVAGPGRTQLVGLRGRRRGPR